MERGVGGLRVRERGVVRAGNHHAGSAGQVGQVLRPSGRCQAVPTSRQDEHRHGELHDQVLGPVRQRRVDEPQQRTPPLCNTTVPRREPRTASRARWSRRCGAGAWGPTAPGDRRWVRRASRRPRARGRAERCARRTGRRWNGRRGPHRSGRWPPASRTSSWPPPPGRGPTTWPFHLASPAGRAGPPASTSRSREPREPGSPAPRARGRRRPRSCRAASHRRARGRACRRRPSSSRSARRATVATRTSAAVAASPSCRGDLWGAQQLPPSVLGVLEGGGLRRGRPAAAPAGRPVPSPGVVAGAGDLEEAGVRQLTCCGAVVVRRDRAVVVAPCDQHGQVGEQAELACSADGLAAPVDDRAGGAHEGTARRASARPRRSSASGRAS